MERDGAPRGPPICPQGKQGLDRWPVGPEGEERGWKERERERACAHVEMFENWDRQSWDALGVGPQKPPTTTPGPLMSRAGGGERWGYQDSVMKVTSAPS